MFWICISFLLVQTWKSTNLEIQPSICWGIVEHTYLASNCFHKWESDNRQMVVIDGWMRRRRGLECLSCPFLSSSYLLALVWSRSC
jgi:hypothetical protein